jgi:copper homeostasis protein
MTGILEICCTSFESAKIAAEGGANRIELCDNLFEGGTTPSAGMILKIKDKVDIGLYVIIRPRGGDFVYSDDEFRIMQKDIQFCHDIGVDGIVSGVLTIDGDIDVEHTKQLVELSGNMDFTFHRAFDLVRNPEKALQDVISTGTSRILTSGLENNVVEGSEMLKDLVELAGNDIKIMAGGGLKSANIQEIIDTTGCNEFHTTAKVWVNSTFIHQSDVKMNGSADIPQDMIMVASLEEVKKLRNIIDGKI